GFDNDYDGIPVYLGKPGILGAARGGRVEFVHAPAAAPLEAVPARRAWRRFDGRPSDYFAGRFSGVVSLPGAARHRLEGMELGGDADGCYRVYVSGCGRISERTTTVWANR